MYIVIANLISFVEMLLSFRRHSEINRNKVIIFDYMIHLTSVAAYILMQAFTGLFINAWCIVKLIYMQLVHKEEKIKLNPNEIIILNIPILVIGIMGVRKEGLIALIFCIGQYLKGWEYWFKTDYSRVKLNAVTESAFALYNGLNLNFVKCFKNCVTVIINLINVYRIRKYGEDKYYGH